MSDLRPGRQIRWPLLYYPGWVLFRLLGIVCGMRRYGAAHIPQSGPFVLAANHRHNLDPFFLGAWINRQVHFFAKQELWKHRLVGWMISRMNAFPVNRGTVDRQAMRQAADAFKRGHGLVFFPEGTRNKTDAPFLPPKHGLGLLISMSGLTVPIVPVYLHGTRQLKDCFLRKERFAMAIGQPITAEEVRMYLTDKEGYQALAERVMAEIARLRQQVISPG